MRILGLTGSIGMGKSTAVQMLRRARVPVHDADAAVHRLMARNGAAVSAIAKAFPGTVRAGAVDRGKLGARVFGRDPKPLRRLEAILHPLVRRETKSWLSAQARRRAKVVVLDVPLLYETGGPGGYDAVVVISAPAFLQRQRVLRRGGMTPGKLAEILGRQLPDREKRARADFVVTSGLGKTPTRRGLMAALRRLPCGRRVWRPGYGRWTRRGKSGI